VSARRRARLSRQLATLQRAGVAPCEALLSLSDQESSAAVRQAMAGMRDAIGRGASWREAADLQQGLFDRSAVALLGAGETSGRLAETWDALAERADLELEVRREVASALFYPVAVLVLGCFLLPLRVLLLEGTGPYLRAALFPLLLGLGLALALWGLWVLGRRRFPGLIAFVYRMPILGPILTKLSRARATATFADSLAAGLPLGTSLRGAGDACPSPSLAATFARTATAVERGLGLAEAFREAGPMPPVFLQVVATAERAGSLPDSLQTLADDERREALHGLKLFVRGATIAFALAVFAYLGWRAFAQVTEIRDSLEKVLDQTLDGEGVDRALQRFRELERELR
jgi:type II secretory pathway component PulF